MKLNISFISQNDPSIPEEWRERSCGIVCLKMCLDAHGIKNKIKIPLISELISEGLMMKGDLHNDAVGWNHSALVWLAHNHGVPAYHEEFRSDSSPVKSGSAIPSEFADFLRDEGIKRIKDSLARGAPAIISFKPGFGSKDNTHLLVVIGHEEGKGFIVHDPSNSDPKEAVFVDEPTFISFWRKFAIFVG